ncbi:hypothetical protein [Bacillus sp. 1P02SD]|uniref:hypothetical protein n=1 Tax=Bacillus sp. 1P02SD TaxID=3132264 RepID=UPI0039A23A4F
MVPVTIIFYLPGEKIKTIIFKKNKVMTLPKSGKTDGIALKSIKDVRERFMNVYDQATFLVSLFTMIATVGAAFAALFSTNIAKNSLKEQSESNKRALEPLLVVESKEVNFILDTNYPPFLINWDTKEYDLSDSSTYYGSSLNLVNIGKGTAKNVSIDIHLENLHSFIEILSKRSVRSDFDLQICDHVILNNTKALMINGIHFTPSTKRLINELFRIENFDDQGFIFISREEFNGTRKIKIPSVFLILYNLIIYLHPIPASFNEMPKLLIHIKYEDIVGTCFENRYSLQVSGIRTISKAGGDEKEVFFSFEVKEI